MTPGFQEGRRPRANALASLTNTGHVSPLARHSRAGVVQQAHQSGVASRPGPQPMSARQATAVNQRNTATRRLVQQVTQQAKTHLNTARVRLPTVPFSTYKPGAPGRESWVTGTDDFGRPWYATKVQEIWVYTRQVDKWGTMEFFVVNPSTRTCVSFTPIGYVSGKDQIQGTASATGEFGRVYSRFLAVTAASLFTAGAAMEFEAGTAALAGTREVLVKGWQFGATQITELGSQIVREFTWGTFITKALLDGTVQFGSGLITKGNATESIGDLNFVSMLVAGIMPGEGWLPALRNSTLTSTVKVGNKVGGKQTGLYVELPELTSMTGIQKYLLNIATGTLGDVVKLRLSEGASPLFRWASRTLNRTAYVDLQWLSAHREVLGTLLPIPWSIYADAQKDKEKERIQTRLDKAMAPKTTSTTPAHPTRK